MKFAFVSAHPAPYRDPFLRRLVKEPGIETKIYTMFNDDKAHHYWQLGDLGYESVLIGRRDEHWLKLYWRLLTKVMFGGYDVICWPGFHRPCVRAAIITSALLGQKYGFCADSVRQPKRSGITMLVKRFVVGRASFIFVPGAASKNFYHQTFGVPENRICRGQYAIEGDVVEQNILNMRNRRAELRVHFGLGANDVVFLMVANMLKTRHYPITSAAFIKFAAQHPGVKFVMVGKGEEMEAMTALAQEHPELVVVPGVSFDEMQELYAIADVYVHGGTEPASSALVIGAIAHLPVMSSPAVGCTADVVREGETGCLVHDYLSADDWYDAFERMMANRDKWATYGERARELSRPLDCDNTIKDFTRIIGGIGK